MRSGAPLALDHDRVPTSSIVSALLKAGWAKMLRGRLAAEIAAA
jgi:hypothetical protein